MTEIEYYRWDPIPDALSDDGFRVLELLPSTPEKIPQLRCKIHTVLLDDHHYEPQSPVLLYPNVQRAPRFAALSYCWGEDVRAHRIYCDGAVLLITENLANALHALCRLRSHDLDDIEGKSLPPEKRRFLWVDAICIDQDNLAERRQQVRLMRRIFSKAEKTLAWLGDVDDPQRGVRAEKLMEVMVTVGRQMNNWNWRMMSDWKSYLTDWSNLMKRTMGDEYYASLEAFHRLFNNSWFSRAWIVQELVLSRDLEVHYGNHIFNWRDIVNAARVCWSDGTWFGDINISANVARLPTLLNEIKDLYSKGYSLQLFDLLQSLSYRIASDPRDLVYSLLGLATVQDFDRHGISPEYGQEVTASSLFLKVAYSILYTKRNLQILECANSFSSEALSAGSVRNELLPSWVPNWEIHTNETIFVQHNSSFQLNAGGALFAWFMVTENNRLILRGILETIVDISSPSPMTVESSAWSMTAINLEDFVTKRYEGRYFNGQTALDVYLETMLFPRRVTDLESIRKQYRSFTKVIKTSESFGSSGRINNFDWIRAAPWVGKLFLAAVTSKDKFSEEANDFWDSIRARRLAWSSRRALSLVPEATVPGDKLFIARGARLPFIVRPLDNGEYHLIGPAYTHGYMDGEAWTRHPKLNIEEIALA